MTHVMIYMASGRTLSEAHDDREGAVDAVRNIIARIEVSEPFWFGRTLVMPEHVEAVFATDMDSVPYDPYYHDRLDIGDMVEGSQ